MADAGKQPRRQSRLTCPTCGKSFSQQRTDAMPFCSQQCQRIDLAHWLNEEIGIPLDPAEGDPSGGPGDLEDSEDSDGVGPSGLDEV